MCSIGKIFYATTDDRNGLRIGSNHVMAILGVVKTVEECTCFKVNFAAGGLLLNINPHLQFYLLTGSTGDKDTPTKCISNIFP